MPKISLIIATLNRTSELDRLITTLANQSYRNFEIIIVDQNNDDRIDLLLQDAKKSGLSVTHIRQHAANLALARNHGIAIAKGKWCGFPDDDCWYEPNTLERLVQRCQQRDKPQGVVGRWIEQDPAYSATSLAWKKSSQFRDLPVASITLFLKKSHLLGLGGFDTRLGVGLWFGAAEETDIVMRALKAGTTIVYDSTIHVHHKVNEAQSELHHEHNMQCKKRARGTGALYAKHRLSPWVIARGLLAPLVRPLLQGQFKQELIKGWAIAQGRYQGWWQWKHHQRNQENYINYPNNVAQLPSKADDQAW